MATSKQTNKSQKIKALFKYIEEHLVGGLQQRGESQLWVLMLSNDSLAFGLVEPRVWLMYSERFDLLFTGC